MGTVAVIPVRAGSRRLRNKNILPFAGSNLLVHKIRQLKCVSGLQEIVVSSDSDEMLCMAADEGVSTHRREARFADDVSVPFGEVVAHVCSALRGDTVLWAPCVCPLTDTEHYEQALSLYAENVPGSNDSLVSFEALRLFLWDDSGPINYGLGPAHVLSQNLPNLYRPTNGIFIAPRKKMVEWRYFCGPNPYKFILDKRAAVDIDDGLDMLCAQAWYAQASYKEGHSGRVFEGE